MENIFVAASNLYALRAIDAARKKKKYLTVTILGCATIGSIVYHLSETKHSMKSLCFKDHTSITLNLDRFFAVYSVGYFISRYQKKIRDKKVIFFSLLGFIAMLLSESQHVITIPPMMEKKLYLITHPIWHICAFHTAYLLVN
jgi:hypothetical protein